MASWENKARVTYSTQCILEYWEYLPCGCRPELSFVNEAGCELEAYTVHSIEEKTFTGLYSYEYSQCNKCEAVFHYHDIGTDYNDIGE